MTDYREQMKDWPAADRDEWAERAAIIQFECKMSREEAEEMAYQYVTAMRRSSRVW